EKIVYNILKILIILTVAFFVVRLSDGWIVEYLRQRALVSGAGKSLPAVQKIIKVVVVIVAALVIFDILELNVTSLIAGLGLGGLAVALAARDTLANLFGSVTVLTDQPFKVGDKIRIEKFEGNVEEVGLRSTRIKTGMGTRIIIPNTKLTTMIVENVSEREGKHKEFAIFLKQTVSSEKIQKAIDIIKSALNENLEMIEDKYCVSFSEISEKGPVISVSYFVKSQKGKAEIVERINFGIKKGLEKIGVELND
ncbi:MAG: mscs mechanosensitive ion channel, partial [uncultured bacterium]